MTLPQLMEQVRAEFRARHYSRRTEDPGTRSPHLLESGYDIRTLQELLGHADVGTTTHVVGVIAA